MEARREKTRSRSNAVVLAMPQPRTCQATGKASLPGKYASDVKQALLEILNVFCKLRKQAKLNYASCARNPNHVM